MSCTLEHLFAVQFNVFISLWFLFIVYILYYGFIYCLPSFFSNAADNEHSKLEIPVERSIFDSNIQKSVPRSLQLKNIVIFKNRNM